MKKERHIERKRGMKKERHIERKRGMTKERQRSVESGVKTETKRFGLFCRGLSRRSVWVRVRLCVCMSV